MSVALKKVFSIKSIPTFYGGRYYRSRTEASWAVLFDLLEIPYAFEEEGFVIKTETDEFCYLPDFLLMPIFDVWPKFIEVKGVWPNADEIDKLVYICRAHSCDGLIVVGKPDVQGEMLWCARDPYGNLWLHRVKQSMLFKFFGGIGEHMLVARAYQFDKGHDITKETLRKMFDLENQAA